MIHMFIMYILILLIIYALAISIILLVFKIKHDLHERRDKDYIKSNGFNIEHLSDYSESQQKIIITKIKAMYFAGMGLRTICAVSKLHPNVIKEVASSFY